MRAPEGTTGWAPPTLRPRTQRAALENNRNDIKTKTNKGGTHPSCVTITAIQSCSKLRGGRELAHQGSKTQHARIESTVSTRRQTHMHTKTCVLKRYHQATACRNQRIEMKTMKDIITAPIRQQEEGGRQDKESSKGLTSPTESHHDLAAHFARETVPYAYHLHCS